MFCLTYESDEQTVKMASSNRGETIQKQIQQDWVNREYIEIITISIKKITDFLNSFGKSLFMLCHIVWIYFLDLSCRSKLAILNEKLTTLERKIDYLEACVSS